MRLVIALSTFAVSATISAQTVQDHFRSESRADDFGACNTMLILQDVNADARPEVFLSHAEYRVGGVHTWQVYSPQQEGVSRYLGNVQVHPRGLRVINGEPGFHTYEGEHFAHWVLDEKGLHRAADKTLDAARPVAVPFWAERCPEPGQTYWGGADGTRLSDVDLTDQVISGAQALSEAARNGDTGKLSQLLDTWVDAYAADNAAAAALVGAADANQNTTLQQLLDLDVRHPVSVLRQASRAAAWQGHTDALKTLLASNLGPARDALVQDALGAASQSGHPGSVTYLLQLGGDASAPTSEWEVQTPLELAAQSGHRTVIDLFSRAGEDVSRALEIALFGAIDQGDEATVRQLLESGVSTESLRPGDYPSPALIWSVQARRPDISLAMIELGADVNVVDGRRDNVVIKAAQYGYIDVINAALARGADTRATNQLGSGALTAAAASGHLDVIKMFTSFDPAQLPGDALSRALVAAVRANQPAIVCHLLTSGADTAWQNALGRDAVRTAEIASLDGMVDLLSDWPTNCQNIGATGS